MGVVYILHGSKFVSIELTMKQVNIFLHFSWLKFLVYTVLEIDFSSKEYGDQIGITLIFIGAWLYHSEGLVVDLAI